MFEKKQNTLQSLSKIHELELLEKLVQQLNKDMYLSGVDCQFSLRLSPRLLINELRDKIATLMASDFSKFTNLMYRIDISEKKIRDFELSELETIEDRITFLVLKKEWQKVWFKNINSQQD